MARPPDSPDPSIDYYALLSITPASSESEIRRAYRKTSIRYHPDKVEPTPANLDKFHQLQIALNLLTDPEQKAKYDQTREAKLRRQAENEALESRRRQLKEDLESREAAAAGGIPGVNGAKRTWTEREVDINRIREENRRKMAEATAAKRARAAEAAQKEQEATKDADGGNPGESVERSVKVRWVREGEGLEIDQQSLEDEFAAGEVENVVLLKDKRRKMEGRDGKVTLGTAVMVFSNLTAAQKAVKRGPWDGIESVEWAVKKAPS